MLPAFHERSVALDFIVGRKDGTFKRDRDNGYVEKEKPFRSKCAAHVCGRDLQRLTIFGDRAAGHHDTLLAQNFRQLAIR